MTKIVELIQLLEPGSIIEMFELDLSPVTGTITASDFVRFTAHTNQLEAAVVWQGLTYQPFPIESGGWESTTKGTLPRPQLRASNVSGVLTALMAGKDDLLGAKLTRRRTYVRYLDAVNFTGGVNATADPTQFLPNQVAYIERKVRQDKTQVEWELASALDMDTAMLPGRIITSSYCQWKYRGTECAYAGTNYFNVDNQAVGTLALDVCSKSVTACKLRFGATAVLNFGGFPAARVYKL